MLSGIFLEMEEIENNIDSFNLIVGINKAKNNRPELQSYNTKVYIFGDIIEFYRYEIPILKGFHTKGRSNFSEEEEIKEDNFKKVPTRKRNWVRRLILANFDSSSRFVTLTFAENIEDIKVSNREFKNFIKRMKYRFGDFKYLSVIEFQERGAIHYHMICNWGYIEQKEVSEIWGNGFIKIKGLLKANNGKPVDNVGAYMVKYMNKNVLDERLMGQDCYLRSRNLSKPVVVYENLNQDDLFKKYGVEVKFNDLANLQQSRNSNYFYLGGYETKDNGHCDYMEFNKRRVNS
jgi:hypothetical protein